MKKVSYFYCYSPKLRKFLSQNGETWTKRERHEKTNKMYWTFEQTERLGKLIKQFTNAK